MGMYIIITYIWADLIELCDKGMFKPIHEEFSHQDNDSIWQ